MWSKSFLRESWSWSNLLSLSKDKFSEDHDPMCSEFFSRESWSWSSSLSFKGSQRPRKGSEMGLGEMCSLGVQSWSPLNRERGNRALVIVF